MSRNFKLYPDDILNSIKKIERYTKGMNREQLIADELTFDAVIYNLQIIGEAVKHIFLEICKCQMSFNTINNVHSEKSTKLTSTCFDNYI